MRDLTNQKELQAKPKKVRFWLKKARMLSLSGLGTVKCRLKKISPPDVKVSAQDIIVTRQTISLAPGTGHVRRGKMKVEEVLKLLEKHESECNDRYKKIDKQLDRLDMRLWGIAILIVATAIAGKFL